MSLSATERQMNLLFVLLNANRPVEREEIRKRVPGYAGKSNEAFERQFERDKEALRQLNIPVETKFIDVFHEDASGYLINRDAWLLPEMHLTTEQRAILNLASAVWQDTQIQTAVSQVAKQLADDDDQPMLANFLSIRLGAQSEQISTCLTAKSSNVCVTFEYINQDSQDSQQRLVAPWRVLLRERDAYLVGFDQDRGEQRTFKLSRVQGNISITNEQILEQAPIDFNTEEIIRSWNDFSPKTEIAVLELLPGMAGELRLLASNIELGELFDTATYLNIDTAELEKQILKHCDAVRIMQPQSLAETIHKKLNQMNIQIGAI